MSEESSALENAPGQAAIMDAKFMALMEKMDKMTSAVTVAVNNIPSHCSNALMKCIGKADNILSNDNGAGATKITM